MTTTGVGWRHRVHSIALQVYRRLPRGLRIRIVRLVAPSFTVGAICVIEREESVLLIRQAYRRGWGIPGGLVQRGEEPAHAARREVREEIGIDVVLHGAPAVVVDVAPQRVDVIFAASIDVLDEPRPSSAEIVEVRWFGRSALPELQPETVAALAALDRTRGDGHRPERRLR